MKHDLNNELHRSDIQLTYLCGFDDGDGIDADRHGLLQHLGDHGVDHHHVALAAVILDRGGLGDDGLLEELRYLLLAQLDRDVVALGRRDGEDDEAQEGG